MSPSPNSSLVQRTMNLNYANKKRSESLKWIILNSVLLLVFVYDLSCKCPGYTCTMHYVELACAVVFAANLVQYAICLMPVSMSSVPLTREQQKLLGLTDADLDSSFVLDAEQAQVSPANASGQEWYGSDAELSPAPRAWRSAASAPPTPSPPPPSPPSPATNSYDSSQDRFIADARSLAAYLKRRSELEDAECSAAAGGASTWAAPPVTPYRLSAATAAHCAGAEPPGAGAAWGRVELDARRLTQYNLNLRVWLHATLLARLVRELAAADGVLARLGASEAGALRAGRVTPARLRAAAPAHPQLAQLLPFLEPFPDQTYLLRRITELAAGGCLSAYRGDSGGAGWTPTHPSDAELLMHLFATYLDSQIPINAAREAGASGVGGATSGVGGATSVWAGGVDGPGVVQVGGRPAQYALSLGGATLAVGGGRNNLLHTLLLFLAAAARLEPPAVRRLHLGPAGLNMLWIIGR